MEIAYEDVDRELTPFGELVLRRFRTSTGETGYEILLDGAFLMATHGSHSERLMARLAWRRLPPRRRRKLHALVGGLGAGHTLRAVLDLEGVERVTVAEIGRRVISWNRRELAPFNGAAVEDSRVEVIVDDVRRVVAEHPDTYDIVLLDVDNGPGWLASPANAALYEPSGLRAGLRALRRGGVLSLWSPARNLELEETLDEEAPGWEVVDTSPEGCREGEPGMAIYLVSRGPTAARVRGAHRR